ncbi:MAG: hypothetical protein EOP83_15215, partial [Verrucomicrobiaceae bacterium]
ARTAADSLNSTAIADEVARATAAEGVLTTNLGAEVTRATAAEALIANSVATETARALAAEALNANAVVAETARATAAEGTLTTNLAAEVTRATGVEAALQAELDRTQTGAGLAADGTYSANSTANYIGGATSLFDADNRLDSAIKAVQSNLSNLSQDSIQSANTLYKVQTTNTAVNLFGDVAGTQTLFANAVTGAAQNSTITLSTAVANEVRFEAHSGTATDVDIRLIPQGDGQVIVGDTGTDGVIQADNGHDLTLAGGDNAGSTGGNLVLAAGQGTANGSVVVKDAIGGNTVATFNAGNAATNLAFSGSATAVTVAAAGSASNIDVVLAPKGTGSVDASNHKIVNVSNGTAATDAVNVSQLQSAVSAAQTAATAGSHRSVSVAVTEATGNVALGVVNGTAVRVKVVVSAAFSAGAAITVGTAGATSELVTAMDIDESAVGMYVIELARDYASTNLVVAVTAGSGATGSAKVYVEYISA